MPPLFRENELLRTGARESRVTVKDLVRTDFFREGITPRLKGWLIQSGMPLAMVQQSLERLTAQIAEALLFSRTTQWEKRKIKRGEHLVAPGMNQLVIPQRNTRLRIHGVLDEPKNGKLHVTKSFKTVEAGHNKLIGENSAALPKTSGKLQAITALVTADSDSEGIFFDQSLFDAITKIAEEPASVKRILNQLPRELRKTDISTILGLAIQGCQDIALKKQHIQNHNETTSNVLEINSKISRVKGLRRVNQRTVGPTGVWINELAQGKMIVIDKGVARVFFHDFNKLGKPKQIGTVRQGAIGEKVFVGASEWPNLTVRIEPGTRWHMLLNTDTQAANQVAIEAAAAKLAQANQDANTRGMQVTIPQNT